MRLIECLGASLGETKGATVQTTISLSNAKAHALGYGGLFAISLLLVLWSPSKLILVLALIFLVLGGVILFFQGCTVACFYLQPGQRRVFQWVVSLMTPLALSSYFLSSLEPVSLSAVIEPLSSVSVWIILGFVWYISWIFAELLDRGLPFRGYLWASAILFFLCVMGVHRISLSGSSDETFSAGDLSNNFDDAKTRHFWYFGYYLLLVTTSYWGMTKKYLRMRRSIGWQSTSPSTGPTEATQPD